MHIRTKPTITIRDYLAGGQLAVDRPASNIVDLKIDKGLYFNEVLDDVMEIQSDINLMGIWSDDAAQQMKITVDQRVLKSMLNAAAPQNRGITAGKISGNINLGVTGTPVPIIANQANPPVAGQVTILQLVLRLGLVLDEQNIPEQGRWIVMPAWAAAMIKGSELRQAYLSGDQTSILRNGRLGMIDRFTLYVSNLLPEGCVHRRRRDRHGGAGGGRVGDLRRSRARADVCFADLQGRDAALRVHVRNAAAGACRSTATR